MKIMIITDRPPETPFRPCVRKGHRWQELCKCGASKVCTRCGAGDGTIPCKECMWHGEA
jgi:hypothetical protein